MLAVSVLPSLPAPSCRADRPAPVRGRSAEGALRSTGGTLGGTGSIAGAVTVNAGGKLAPGASVGTLKTGNLTLAGTFEPEIDWTSPATPSADLVEVTGTVNVTGGTLSMVMLNVPIGGATFSPDKVVVLVKNDGTDAVSGTFASIVPPPYLTLQYTVLYNYNADGGSVGNDIALSFSGVPEPASLSVVALGGLLLRRKGQRQ